MAYRDGLYHLFFSAFDQERSTVVHVTTHDWVSFSPFHFQLDGRNEDWIGMCSPDITFGDGRYVIVLNSWGEAHGRPNMMFYMESPDLKSWSSPRPLGHNLAPDARIIDGALAWTGKVWICVCKWWKHPRIAWAPHLDGPWRWVSEKAAQLKNSVGEENGYTHENFQLLQIDGVWNLLSTDYTPSKKGRQPSPQTGTAATGIPFQRGISGSDHTPWLYRLPGDPAQLESWLEWEGGFPLEVPAEDFNTIDRINAAAIMDHRSVDGHFYLIYGGKGEERREEFAGTAAHGRPWARGWNRLGIARSPDLRQWSLPGN